MVLLTLLQMELLSILRPSMSNRDKFSPSLVNLTGSSTQSNSLI